MNVMNKCRACRFWEFTNETINMSRGKEERGSGCGICKRHSPIPETWPTTLGNNWCGDFEKIDWPEENPPESDSEPRTKPEWRKGDKK
jgi:hypothetical protein